MPHWKTASKDDQRRLEAARIILKKYPWRLDQIFQRAEPCLAVSPQFLMRSCANAAERIMIGLAFDVWNGIAGVKASDLLSLDDENFQNVVSALLYLRM